MSVYVESRNTIRIQDDNVFVVHDELPVRVYKVCQSLFGFYLAYTDELEIKHKIYGNANTRVDRIIKTFEDRPFTTGVLLSGNKGSGKTMLTKRLAEVALSKGYPVIICEKGEVGSNGFVDFISSIRTPSVIVLDEFEKMFQEDTDQNDLLGLFDGLYSKNKNLFLLTANDYRKVNNFFIARPGRIYYHFKYKGVDQETISEYCQDRGVMENFMAELLVYAQNDQELSFDSMIAIVDEHIRFGDSFDDTIENLNISEYSRWKNHETTIWDVDVVDLNEKKTYKWHRDMEIKQFHNHYVGFFDIKEFGNKVTKAENDKFYKNWNFDYRLSQENIVENGLERVVYKTNDGSFLIVFNKVKPKFDETDYMAKYGHMI